MIKSFLKGADKNSNKIFNELISKIGYSKNIAWYPSSGYDFRDLIEVNRTSIEPDIFFHTDYNNKWVDLNCGEVFNDGSTRITINTINELKFRKKVGYFVNPKFVDFPDDAHLIPKIYLLNVKIECGFGKIIKPVIYFFMENINFLEEVLLKNKINISHFIKIREGCGFGGNRKSISIVYAFLGLLNVKYLIIDNQESIDKQLIFEISKKQNLQLKKFKLKNISQRRNISDWSGFSAKVLEVISINDDFLNENDLDEILKIVRDN